MFTPKYTLSGKLLKNISTIERFYGQIEAMRIPKQLEINLNRKNLIQSSYSSNKIEGNPLTLPEVTNLLLDDRIPVNRDEKEVVNYFDFLKDLETLKDTKFSTDFIKEIHSRVFSGVKEPVGEIRNVKVVVGKYNKNQGEAGASFRVKHDPPYHKREKIKKSLKELFSWIDIKNELPPVIRIGIFHHQFVFVHPFEDGNGRVCRLLTALLFNKEGYRINKYFVLDDYYDIDRHQYSDKLHTADSGDLTEWLEYFTDGVKYSLQSALSRVKEGMRSLDIKNRPTNKEQEVLAIIQEQPQITSTDVAEKLKVSRQQAHNLLRSLVDKGFVDRKGSTKSSFYILK